MHSPARIMPATGGTKDTLPGTARPAVPYLLVRGQARARFFLE